MTQLEQPQIIMLSEAPKWLREHRGLNISYNALLKRATKDNLDGAYQQEPSGTWVVETNALAGLDKGKVGRKSIEVEVKKAVDAAVEADRQRIEGLIREAFGGELFPGKVLDLIEKIMEG